MVQEFIILIILASLVYLTQFMLREVGNAPFTTYTYNTYKDIYQDNEYKKYLTK